eukprot:1250664-Rhodomonas_salina.1
MISRARSDRTDVSEESQGGGGSRQDGVVESAICIRMRYAMPGTELRDVLYWHVVKSAICIRMRYAMPGTDMWSSSLLAYMRVPDDVRY